MPARNEARRLPPSIDVLRRYMSDRSSCELVLAADETSTDATVDIARHYAEDDPRIRVVTVASRGKGNAVRVGTKAARGTFVVMADADLSVGPAQFDALLRPARSGAVAIASRSASGARRRKEPATRFVLGRVFNLAVRALVLPGVQDTQCGFKAFPRETGLQLLERVLADGWVFDVEFLALARSSGLEVVEVPVSWTFGPGSGMRPLRDAPRIVRDLLSVWRRVGRVPRRHSSRVHSPSTEA